MVKCGSSGEHQIGPDRAAQALSKCSFAQNTQNTRVMNVWWSLVAVE